MTFVLLTSESFKSFRMNYYNSQKSINDQRINELFISDCYKYILSLIKKVKFRNIFNSNTHI